MKITICYDNETRQRELLSDWGFSCHIDMGNGTKLLFDTGADGYILLHNMAVLGLDPSAIDLIVISHCHYDHTSGLDKILALNKKAKVFLPSTCSLEIPSSRATFVRDASQIDRDISTTGELRNMEQSLIINTEKGLIVIVGCSHPGLKLILNKASEFGQVFGVVGGLHGFREFQLLTGLDFICPCHCTQYKDRIKAMWPDKCIECGTGKEIEL